MEIKRCYETIIGATVNVNQLVQNGNFADGLTGWNFPSATATISDGLCEVSLDYITQHQIYVNVPQKVQNHKVLITYTAQGSVEMNMSINWGITLVPTHRITDSKINYSHIATVGSGNDNLVFLVTSEIGDKIKLSNINIIDLTDYFGTTIADYVYSLETATAGAGIAKLRSWGFLGGYIPYNAGSIESVEVTSKKIVGFNQWDEVWEVGYIVPSTGELNNRTDRIRTKNYIPVIGGTGYYFHTLGMIMNCIWYDANHNYIRNNSPNNEVITSPQNARYCKFSMPSDYGTTYNHDICINLSSSRNGEYEPYKSITYELGSDVLRGIFKLDANNQLYADGDRKTADGTITRRYGIVDLGTLNWTYISATGVFWTNLPPAKRPGNLMCSRYVQDFSSRVENIADKSIWNVGYAYSATNLVIKDSAYTDGATFKTAMNGVMLVCELTTPTIETSTPFTSPQIVYPEGTEEFVTENGLPVGHETKYQL